MPPDPARPELATPDAPTFSGDPTARRDAVLFIPGLFARDAVRSADEVARRLARSFEGAAHDARATFTVEEARVAVRARGLTLTRSA